MNKKGYDIAAIAWISDVKLYLHLVTSTQDAGKRLLALCTLNQLVVL